MPSTPILTRPELHRVNSWPPSIQLNTTSPANVKPRSGSMSATTSTEPAFDKSSFENELEAHPEDHYLSSVYTYEDWASDDSDADDEEVEWNAGITDFALFDNDRRRAQETHDRLPSKWGDLLAQQAAALRRSAKRIRDDAASDPRTGGLFAAATAEDMPGLTPDSSPSLRDDLETFNEDDATPLPPMRRSSGAAGDYLTVIVTPPPEGQQTYVNDDDDYEDEFCDLQVFIDRNRKRTTEVRRMQRPGLSFGGRTLSGKAHVWRRPSWEIYPVGEDAAGEEKAERDGNGAEEEGEVDGWRVLRS